jgi:hypothetical protein
MKWREREGSRPNNDREREIERVCSLSLCLPPRDRQLVSRMRRRTGLGANKTAREVLRYLEEEEVQVPTNRCTSRCNNRCNGCNGSTKGHLNGRKKSHQHLFVAPCSMFAKVSINRNFT